MYIHVPFAQVSLLAYLVLFIGSVWYLWKKDPVIDNLNHATAGVGPFSESVNCSPAPSGKTGLEHVVDMGRPANLGLCPSPDPDGLSDASHVHG